MSCPPAGDLPNLKIEPRSPTLQVDSLLTEPPSSVAQFKDAAAAKSLQSCPILYDPMNCGSPGSSVHGILQARMLEWVPCPSPGDLPNPGIEPTALSVACVGRWILYY